MTGRIRTGIGNILSFCLALLLAVMTVQFGQAVASQTTTSAEAAPVPKAGDLTVPAANSTGDATTEGSGPASKWDWKGCQFRTPEGRNGSGNPVTGNPAPQIYANSLCWIDWTGVDFNKATSTTPVHVERDLGRYRLSFDLTRPLIKEYKSGKWTDSEQAVEVSPHNTSTGSFGSDIGTWAASAFGWKMFGAHTGDNSRPVIFSDMGKHPGGGNQQLVRLRLTNIKLTDTIDNSPVSNYTLTMADTESTTGGEGQSIDNLDDSYGNVKYGLLPDGARCSEGNSNVEDGLRLQGSGPSWEWGRSVMNDSGANRRKRDFVCVSVGSGKMFVAATKSPRQLEMSLWSWAQEGIGLAINFSRVSGKVEQPDTSYEEAVTGQRTTFDLTARTSEGNSIDLPKDGSGAAVARENSDDTLLAPKGGLVFTSTAAGAQAGKALQRYRPEWRCTVGDGEAWDIDDKSDNPGFKLDNKGTSSELTVTNSINKDNEPVDCQVNWVSRFDRAQLNLSKTVKGDAAQFDSVQGRTYQIHYDCGDGTDADSPFRKADFVDAYPDVTTASGANGVTLSGDVKLLSGDKVTRDNLPAGASCTLSETFTDIKTPPAPSGLDLTQTWTGQGTDGKTPDTDVTVTDGNGTHATRTRVVTLQKLVTGQTSGSTTAVNTYTQRMGTLHVDKELVSSQGDGAIAALFGSASSRKYDFDLTCPAANYDKKFSLTISEQGNGYSSPATDIKVPVAVDCYLHPLTGLSNDEGTKFEFEGRDVTVNGGKPIAPEPDSSTYKGSYKVKLPDYSPSEAESSAKMHLRTSYDYVRRNVTIVDQVDGPGRTAAEAGIRFFSVNYTCRYGADDANTLHGELTVPKTQSTDGITEFTVPIKNVPVGATCTIYQDGVAISPSTLDIVKATGTQLTFADANDATTVLSNDEARTKPIMTVQTTAETNQNRVLITNGYAPVLGTVRLTGAVVNPDGRTDIPGDLTVKFDCGSRTVMGSDGRTYRSVPLTGAVTVASGGSAVLKANTGNVNDDALVNDQNGVMGVPYGQTCQFFQTRPDGLSTDIRFSSDANQQNITMGKATTDANRQAAVTVTDTFTSVSKGLTISRAAVGTDSKLAQNVSYTLSCTTSAGEPIDLGSDASFTLGAGTTGATASDTKTFTGQQIPKGSTCHLAEDRSGTGAETYQRTSQLKGGGTFPVTRTSTMQLAGGSDLVQKSDGSKNPIEADFTVGIQSSLTIDTEYGFVNTQLTLDKDVAFAAAKDGSDETYISPQRKAIKHNRAFPMTVNCTTPDGQPLDGFSQPMSDYTGTETNPTNVEKAPTLVSGAVPVGSSCMVAEGASSTSTGISLATSIAVDKAKSDSAEGAQRTFFVRPTNAADGVPVSVTNTYRRNLAPVKLSKHAELPGSIQKAYDEANALRPDLDQKIPYYTHSFTMTCLDPKVTGSDGREDVVLGTFHGQITGAGTYTFPDVPSGTDCSIVGDHFGELGLSLQAPRPDNPQQTDQLKAYLKPKQIKWVADGRNDSTAKVESEDVVAKAGGTTTSDTFQTVASGNAIDIYNNYRYVTSPVQLTKKVVTTSYGFDKLNTSKPTFEFDVSCRAVGLQTSTGGGDLLGGGPTLPHEVTWDQIKGASPHAEGKNPNTGQDNISRSYSSDKVNVPAGATCTMTEKNVTGTPQSMQVNAGHSGPLVVTGEAPSSAADTGATADKIPVRSSWDFVNTYTRRMIPVRLAMMQASSWAREDPEGYQVDVSCHDTATTHRVETFTRDQADSSTSVASDSAPTRARTIALPADSSCDVSLAGSKALAARGDLEVTQGSRTPFVVFGQWDGNGVAAASNPKDDPVRTPVDQVTAEQKSYTYSIDLPADISVPTGKDVAMTVGAEAVHLHASATPSLIKMVSGGIAQNARMTFTSPCFPDDKLTQTINPGDELQFKSVPVGTSCEVTETDGGIASVEPWLSVSDKGKYIGDDPGVTNTSAVRKSDGTAVRAGTHSVNFLVNPVNDPADLSTSGDGWRITVLDTYPSMQVTKRIAGAATTSTLNGPVDTAMLDPDATTMDVTYTIDDNGGFDLTKFTLKDPSLAGRQVRSQDGGGAQSSQTVDADGTIPAGACNLDQATVKAGDKTSCTITVELGEPKPPAWLKVPAGAVTVSATVATTASSVGEITATSNTYGAIRPVASLLPTTGMQTLLLVLLLGLVILGIGLWQHRRDQ